MVSQGLFHSSLLFLGQALPKSHYGAARSDVWNAVVIIVVSELFQLEVNLQAPQPSAWWPSLARRSAGFNPNFSASVLSLGSAYTVLCIVLGWLLGWATHQWVRGIEDAFDHEILAGLGLQSSTLSSPPFTMALRAMSGCWVVLALWRFGALVKSGRGIFRVVVHTAGLCLFAGPWLL